MTCAVPASVKAACRQRRMRLRADYPDRIIVESGARFLPAPQTESRHRRARKLNPIWVSTYEDDGRRIVLGPYRELYDDPANGIHELSAFSFISLVAEDGTFSLKSRTRAAYRRQRAVSPVSSYIIIRR